MYHIWVRVGFVWQGPMTACRKRGYEHSVYVRGRKVPTISFVPSFRRRVLP